jgi:hypothetical protein
VYVSHYVLPLSLVCLYFLVLCVYFLYIFICVKKIYIKDHKGLRFRSYRYVWYVNKKSKTTKKKNQNIEKHTDKYIQKINTQNKKIQNFFFADHRATVLPIFVMKSGARTIPNMCSNIPASPAYGVYISQLIRYARGSSNYSDFLKRHLHLRDRLLDQGYEKIRLIRSLKKFIFRYQYLVEIYSVFQRFRLSL